MRPCLDGQHQRSRAVIRSKSLQSELRSLLALHPGVAVVFEKKKKNTNTHAHTDNHRHTQTHTHAYTHKATTTTTKKETNAHTRNGTRGGTSNQNVKMTGTSGVRRLACCQFNRDMLRFGILPPAQKQMRRKKRSFALERAFPIQVPTRHRKKVRQERGVKCF